MGKLNDWWRNATGEKRPEPNPARMITVDEIPLYRDEPSPQYQSMNQENSLPLKEEFALVRRAAVQNFGSVQKIFDKFSQRTKKGIEQSQELSNKLNEEYGALPKAAAITTGGLTGFLLGMKRSLTRRFIYSGVGFLAMSAFCYPIEATEIMQQSFKYIQDAWKDFSRSPQPSEYNVTKPKSA